LLTPILLENSLTTCQTSFSVTLSPPNSTGATHAAEEAAHIDTGGHSPVIQQAMHPLWNGNGPNVTGLSPQVYDRPMPRTLLEVVKGQLCEFVTAKSTCEQYSKQCTVAFAFDPFTVRCLPECLRCWAVSQLPSLTPNFFTPLTRRYLGTKQDLVHLTTRSS
jgi:hypothetical protein